ncbi:hypothetical protein H0H81_001213 [Sphagnurus paluster]|uniref:Uncharacterized protein n=1 Tax=Sphagnurus paluster TaxID=117069 RepID=A0A9P7FZY0_9AGAR|nr:hypothetical protein H0H81_001213 [Sphagnurus paluster]
MLSTLEKIGAHRRTAEQITQSQPAEARKYFTWALQAMIGYLAHAMPLVSNDETGGVRYLPYIVMDGEVKANVMACCVGMAKTWMVEKNPERALAWLEEVRVLHHNTRFILPFPFFGEFLSRSPPSTDA